MPNPQQPVSGDALVVLCASKIQQRDHHLAQKANHIVHVENHDKQAAALTAEIASIHEAIKAGAEWAPPAPPIPAVAVLAARPGSASIPRPATGPV